MNFDELEKKYQNSNKKSSGGGNNSISDNEIANLERKLAENNLKNRVDVKKRDPDLSVVSTVPSKTNFRPSGEALGYLKIKILLNKK